MELNHTLMAFLFFVYGLASFGMGLVVALELRRSTDQRLSSSLAFLAAFGLVHGAAQWTLMFHLIATQGTTVEGALPLRILFLALLALSAFFLIQFGVRMLNATLEGYRWLRWLPWGLTAVWLASFTLPQAYGLYAAIGVAHLPPTSQCLNCHWGTAPAYVVASSEWLTNADVWSRYLLFVPGSVLAAIALAAQAPLLRGMNLAPIARDANWAAGAFLFSALVMGVVVPPTPYPPASVLNHATMTKLLIVPPQVLWLVAILLVTFFVVRILRVFELERQRQLRAVVVEERERIAREIHDSVAQALGYLSLRASAAVELLQRGELAKAEADLSTLEAVADEAYQDVRTSIFDLRSTAHLDKGLLLCLTEYVRWFSLDSGVNTDVVADEAASSLSPGVEVQALRIIQEALANVRKHAQATRVQVSLQRRGDLLAVSVEDNGRGFDLAQAQTGVHFGLQTMRERAQSVGGNLQVVTAPGVGTRIVLELPLDKEQKRRLAPRPSSLGAGRLRIIMQGGRRHGAHTRPAGR